VGGTTISHTALREFVKDTYMRNVRFFGEGSLPETVEMLSDEFFEAWRIRSATRDVFDRPTTLGGPISFCYIDGDHSYDAAHRDFLNTDEFLEPGGFVLFDDSADGSGWEVCRVIEEVKRSGRYEIAAQNPNYMFRKRR
jgi:hypothetical protein